MRLDAGATGLDLAVTTGAAEGTTRTVSFSFAAPLGAPLRTSLAGGYAEHVPEHVYAPTYWPAVGWASVGTQTMLLSQSTGVRFSATGDLELMAVRDARKELCDMEGGVGSDTATHRIEWRLETTASPAAAEQAAQVFNRPVFAATVPLGGTAAPAMPSEDALLTVEGEGIVSALKPADRGAGVILRAQLMPGPLTVHLSHWIAAGHAVHPDSSERDLGDLGPIGGSITLDRAHFGAIATVRLLP